MDVREQLQKEIEEKKAELKRLEKEEKTALRDLAVKKLSEFTDEEKIKAFDKLYKSSLEDLKLAKINGYDDEDSDAYFAEEMREIVARDIKLFWKYRNSLTS
jgi:hypothetical protein